MTIKDYYKTGKLITRTQAIEFQQALSETNYSLNELLEIRDYFIKYGKKYGLLKEFRENGVI